MTQGDRRAFYFGCLDAAGHFLHVNGARKSLVPEAHGIPWPIGMLDQGLLRAYGVSDGVTGIVTHALGVSDNRIWHAFVWWDRSDDSRPGSNSGFYVSGFMRDEVEAAFEFAKGFWPEVVSRQKEVLVLKK